MSPLRDALNALRDNGLSDDEVVAVVEQLVKNNEINDCDDHKYLALVSELGVDVLDADETSYDDCIFDTGAGEFMVLTEDEKESRWDDSLDSYLDEGCVEGADSPYFDRAAWKRDARMDGAGHCLSGYDGVEYEFNGFGTWFFIYRTN